MKRKAIMRVGLLPWRNIPRQRAADMLRNMRRDGGAMIHDYPGAVVYAPRGRFSPYLVAVQS